MRLKWTRPALIDFASAQAYIAAENPQAATMVAKRIQSAALTLKDQPHIGRASAIANTREWVVPKTPYLIIYRIIDERVEILRLWHGKQNWKGEF